MDRVVRGNPITREAHYLLDGLLADPTLPRISILDPLDVVVVLDAIPTRISAGIWQYAYPVAADAMLGFWSSRWSGDFGGIPVPPSSDFFEVIAVGSVVPAPVSSYTYDPSTDVGRLRLMVQDHDMSSVSLATPLEQRSAAFSDEEMQVFLDLNGSSLLPSAAAVMRTWATSKQLIVVARRSGKADVDYGSIRSDMLRMAEAFDTAANQQPADAMAEVAYDEFTARRILANYWQRHDA
jgi:hypothetical protein